MTLTCLLERRDDTRQGLRGLYGLGTLLTDNDLNPEWMRIHYNDAVLGAQAYLLTGTATPSAIITTHELAIGGFTRSDIFTGPIEVF